MNNELSQSNDGATETLPTALDVGRSKTQSVVDPAPVTTEVFKALRESKPLPRSVLLNGHSVQTTGQTIDTFAFLIERDLAEGEAISKLRELQARMVAIHDKVSEFSPGRVNAFLFSKRDESHAAVATGKEPVDVPSREHVQQNFSIRRTGLLAQLVGITSAEVVPLCRPILESFSAALEESMRDMEIGDQEFCTAYGLPYEPSLAWKAAATVAAKFTSRRLPGPQAWALPSHVLENLIAL